MSIHAPHPKCPQCQRALYKSNLVGAKVSTSDPYAFCRNPTCAYVADQEIAAPVEAPPPAPPPPVARPTPSTVKRRARPANEPASTPRHVPSPEKPGEPVAVIMARARIKALIADITEGQSKAAIGLSLAILNQELSCHAGANALIDEFQLGRFGLSKFVSDAHEDVASDE